MLTHDDEKQLLGKTPSDRDFDVLLRREDVDVIDRDTGATILKLRTGVIRNSNLFAQSWSDIDRLEPPSVTRAYAAGELDIEKLRTVFPSAVGFVPAREGNNTTGHLVMSDGRIQKSQPVSNPVFSYLAGYGCHKFTMRAVENRLTKHFPERWANSIPFYQSINEWHGKLVPDVHLLHLKRIEEFHPRWRIPETALSTVTINVNYESTYHYDVGDFKNGFSTISAVRLGDYDGGFLVFPHYRIAVDLHDGDVAVKQSHLHLHGNTRLVPLSTGAKRVSSVNYLKHKLATAPNRLEGPSEHKEWFRGKRPIASNRDLMSSLKKSKKS